MYMKIQTANKSFCVDGTSKEQGKTNTFFMGNQNQTEDRVEEKRKQAQEKALKLVGDTFAREKKIDDDLEEKSNHIKQLEEENLQIENQQKKNEASLKDLRDHYEVSEDSQEQKDLELLEKRNQSQIKGRGVFLTQEDTERLKEIDEAGMTEYQKRALPILDDNNENDQLIEDNKKKILAENAAVIATKLERLKSTPMLKATQEAEEIKKAASEEIKGMLIQDAKEHIDEVQEETKEKAEEKAEKEEAEQELLDAIKENVSEQEKQTETIEENAKETQEIIEGASDSTDVTKELQKIAEEMKLLEEELKGASVDRMV